MTSPIRKVLAKVGISNSDKDRYFLINADEMEKALICLVKRKASKLKRKTRESRLNSALFDAGFIDGVDELVEELTGKEAQ